VPLLAVSRLDRPLTSDDSIAAPTMTADLYDDFKKSSYFPSLNGIRAICALMVIKEHAGWKIDGAPQMLEWGFLGVDMFFVISGFLIVSLLLRERDRQGHIDLRQFYIRRTLRIFPIYYLLIGLLFLVVVASYGHSTKTWDLFKWSFPVFLLYLQDLVPISLGLLFHTWSLAMEEQFYLMWPSVERFLSRGVVPTLLLLVVLNQLFNFGCFNDSLTAIYGPSGPFRPVFLITFTPILLGVLGAHALHDPAVGRLIAALLGNRFVPPLLLAVAVLVCELSTQLQGLTRLTLHCLFCLLLMALVINPRGVFSRTLQSRVMSYLGSISYGVYLYHTFILWALTRLFETRGLMLPPVAMFALAAPLAVCVAGMSFKYFETPMMNIRNRRAARRAATAA
jgi:peptidoglycan/LPS O-acetylase OafA/YrhL